MRTTSFQLARDAIVDRSLLLRLLLPRVLLLAIAEVLQLAAIVVFNGLTSLGLVFELRLVTARPILHAVQVPYVVGQPDGVPRNADALNLIVGSGGACWLERQPIACRALTMLLHHIQGAQLLLQILGELLLLLAHGSKSHILVRILLQLIAASGISWDCSRRDVLLLLSVHRGRVEAVEGVGRLALGAHTHVRVVVWIRGGGCATARLEGIGSSWVHRLIQLSTAAGRADAAVVSALAVLENLDFRRLQAIKMRVLDSSRITWSMADLAGVLRVDSSRNPLGRAVLLAQGRTIDSEPTSIKYSIMPWLPLSICKGSSRLAIGHCVGCTANLSALAHLAHVELLEKLQLLFSLLLNDLLAAEVALKLARTEGRWIIPGRRLGIASAGPRVLQGCAVRFRGRLSCLLRRVTLAL